MYSLVQVFVCLVAVTAALLHSAASEVSTEAVLDHNSAVACDGTTAKLQCQSGSVIDITDTFYGRKSDDYCTHGPRLNYDCSAAGALGVARARCNLKQSCDLPSNIFGDPCRGTLKYLHVTYSCKATNVAVACDGTTAELLCPHGTAIVITDALYGRKSDDYCPRGPKHNNDCSAASALGHARARCNLRQSCELPANAYLDDPCAWTLKYWHVTYICKAVHTRAACGDQDVVLACPNGQRIALFDIFYGRVSDEFCAGGPRSDYNCVLPNAMGYFESCNNVDMCTIRFNSKQPDPCLGTTKYAIAAFECRR